MKLKLADEKDAQIIALLGRITFGETFGHLFTDKSDLVGYLDQTFGVKKIKSSLVKKNNVFWLAYWEGLPVGYAKLKLDSHTPFLEGDGHCQLQKIYVLREFISKKIGVALQEELLNHATKLGFRQLWLSVLKSNDRAIGFYNKHGFTVSGEHTFQIGKQVFEFQLMSKGL